MQTAALMLRYGPHPCTDLSLRDQYTLSPMDHVVLANALLCRQQPDGNLRLALKRAVPGKRGLRAWLEACSKRGASELDLSSSRLGDEEIAEFAVMKRPPCWKLDVSCNLFTDVGAEVTARRMR